MIIVNNNAQYEAMGLEIHLSSSIPTMPGKVFGASPAVRQTLINRDWNDKIKKVVRVL